MKRITDQKTELAKNALLECIEKTAGIEDKAELNKQAFDVLYKHLGDQPELLKRACEAYNHKKSLYKLESATDDTRGDSFAILDAPALYEKALNKKHTEDMTKVASASMKPMFWADEVPMAADIAEEIPLQKFASAETAVQYVDKPWTPREAQYELTEELRGDANLIYKYANELDSARVQFSNAMDRMTLELATMPMSMRKQAASLIVSVMGSFGDSLIDEFNKKRPMQKLASVDRIESRGTLRFPNDNVYKYAKMAKKASDTFNRTRKALLDFSDDIIQHLSNDFLPATGLSKRAAGLASVVATGAIMKSMPEAFGITDGDYNKVAEKLFTPTVQNKVRELSTKRALYELYNDDYISSFSDDQIVDAFNQVLQQLPPSERLRPALNTALIKSRVIDYLGRGGVASAADADKILAQSKMLAPQSQYKTDIEGAVVTRTKE